MISWDDLNKWRFNVFLLYLQCNMSGQCVIYQVNVPGLGYNWTTFYTPAAVTTGWGTNSAHLQLNKYFAWWRNISIREICRLLYTCLDWLERCDLPSCWTALSALQANSTVRWTRRRWLDTRVSECRDIPSNIKVVLKQLFTFSHTSCSLQTTVSSTRLIESATWLRLLC